ncbi:unnamed protein product, partial [Laminaria digitata]
SSGQGSKCFALNMMMTRKGDCLPCSVPKVLGTLLLIAFSTKRKTPSNTDELQDFFSARRREAQQREGRVTPLSAGQQSNRWRLPTNRRDPSPNDSRMYEWVQGVGEELRKRRAH